MYFRFISLSLACASCQAFAPHRASFVKVLGDRSSCRSKELYQQGNENSHSQRLTHLFLSQNPNSAKSSDVSVQEQEAKEASKPGLIGGDFDVSNLTYQMTESMSKVMNNMSSGEFGTRGELFVVGQLVLMLCIIYGDIPLLGDTLKFFLGPGMFVLGGVVAGLGVKELGSNISPFPKVGDNTDLVTDGIFGEIRHPIYAGLLYACLGISVWSGSATRLLLTAALWYLLTKKSDFEERTLVEKFPAYEDYLLEVEGKFIPERLLKSMPWVDKDQ